MQLPGLGRKQRSGRFRRFAVSRSLAQLHRALCPLAWGPSFYFFCAHTPPLRHSVELSIFLGSLMVFIVACAVIHSREC